MSGLAGRWVEHFTLRSAASAAQADDPQTRGRRRVALAQARQKLAAADALRPIGQRGEALALVVEALALLVESAEAPSVHQGLGALGVRDAEQIAAQLVDYARRPAVFDAAFSGDDERAHHRLRVAAAQAVAGAVPRASSAQALRSIALMRSLSALALVVVAVLVAVIVALPRPRVLVVPSAVHGPAYVAANARDANPDTAWLLPDATTGHLELQLSPPRSVHAITMLNAHNAPFNDRATKGFTVELWRGAQKLAARDGEFAFTPSPTPTTIELAGSGVDRIRFVVKSHHQRGAGLAELSFR